MGQSSSSSSSSRSLTNRPSPPPAIVATVPLPADSRTLYFRYQSHTNITALIYTGIDLDQLSLQLIQQCSSSIVNHTELIVSGLILSTTAPICPFFLVDRLSSNTNNTAYQLILCKLTELAIHRPPHLLSTDHITVYQWELLQSINNNNNNNNNNDTGTELLSLSKSIVQSLQSIGFIRISITNELNQLISAAQQSAIQYFQLPIDIKSQSYHQYCHSKFVGYCKQGAREFYQLRTNSNNNNNNNNNNELIQSSAINNWLVVYNLLQSVARQVLFIICQNPELGLDWNRIKELLDYSDINNNNNSNNNNNNNTSDTVGADVFRVYSYYRPADSLLPGLTAAATGLHADMGLLTVSPQSNLTGLSILHPQCTHWIDAESIDDSNSNNNTTEHYLYLFAGETLSALTAGLLRAPVHFVDEKILGQYRISMPYFLRARPDSTITINNSESSILVSKFIESEVLIARPWIYGTKPKISNNNNNTDDDNYTGGDY